MVPFLRQLVVLFVLLCGLTTLVVPANASSGEAAPGRTCWASIPAIGSPAQAIAEADWQCRMRISALQGERVAARLPVADADGRPVRYLRAGLGPFERLTLIARGQDGARAISSLTPDQTTPVMGRPAFAAELPQIAQPAAYYAVFDRPESGHILRAVQTSADPPGMARGDRTAAMLLAILVGMLAVPALLDLAIFRALRRTMFLYHALATLSVAGLLIIWSGLLFEFADLSMAAWYRLLMLNFGLCAASACIFKRAYTLDSGTAPFAPRALLAAAIYSVAVTAIYLAGLLDGFLRDGTFAYAFVPVLVLLCATMLVGFVRGNVMARIQVAGWAPLLLFFVMHIAGDILSFRMPADGLPFLCVGVFVEAVVSAIGISVRFLEIRRERDLAQVRAQVMGNLAERDHLTGLLNRRAIDNRFEDLRARGYDTMALIDLDHFKAINDVSGHAVGDQVLEITARVLASDPDNIAVRLGGEEFLLLMRGTEAVARAEKLRRMVSVRVAREVDGLEQIVTASMGLLSLPADGFGALTFSSAYSRADLLLYQAKNEGRNRTKAAQWEFLAQSAEDEACVFGLDIRDRPAVAA